MSREGLYKAFKLDKINMIHVASTVFWSFELSVTAKGVQK